MLKSKENSTQRVGSEHWLPNNLTHSLNTWISISQRRPECNMLIISNLHLQCHKEKQIIPR